jgi:hypothetical protein
MRNETFGSDRFSIILLINFFHFFNGDENTHNGFLLPVFTMYQFDIDKIHYLEKLGEGAFGQVWKVRGAIIQC